MSRQGFRVDVHEPPRVRHRLGLQHRGHLARIREPRCNLRHGPARLQRLLGHGGGLLVPQQREQRGDYADRVIHQFLASLGVGRDAVDALGTKRVQPAFHQVHVVEEVVDDDGLEHVELELRRLGRGRDGVVGAYHLETHLVHHLRDHRVDLPRHDGRSGSRGGQVDLVEPAPRTRREQPQVVANLAHLDRDATEDVREEQERRRG
mmetsp:Transcript_6671/g.30141  ORF Transcript_6671/g.30141 Transcript_6671/m.30141 type:complete len:206 (+) Transcript_6671:114-731(+)